MYTLFTDKPELFKCNIDLEGASISDTFARLVIESKNINLLFEGQVTSDGACTIQIPKLKDYLKDVTDGVMKLEVIAEDTYFSPWQDSFKLKPSKKVTVEVAGSKEELIKESKPKVSVAVAQEKTSRVVETKQPVKKAKPSTDKHGLVIARLLERRGVTLANIDKKSGVLNRLLETYLTNYEVETAQDQLLSEILNNLK